MATDILVAEVVGVKRLALDVDGVPQLHLEPRGFVQPVSIGKRAQWRSGGSVFSTRYLNCCVSSG